MSADFENDKSVVLAALEEARRFYSEGQHNQAEPLFLEAIRHLSPGDEAVGPAITCLTEIYARSGRHYDAYLINQTFIDGAAPIDSGTLREPIGIALERMSEMCQILGDSNIAQVLLDKAQGIKAGRLQSASLVGRFPSMDDPRRTVASAALPQADTTNGDEAIRARPQRPSQAVASTPSPQAQFVEETTDDIAAEQWPAKNKPPHPGHAPVPPAAAEPLQPPATARPTGPPPPSPKHTGTKLQQLVALGPSPRKTTSQPALQPNPETAPPQLEQQEVFEPLPVALPGTSQAAAPGSPPRAPSQTAERLLSQERPSGGPPPRPVSTAPPPPPSKADEVAESDDSEFSPEPQANPVGVKDNPGNIAEPQSWLASKRAKATSERSTGLITQGREDWSKRRDKQDGESKRHSDDTVDGAADGDSPDRTAADARNLRDKMVSFDRKTTVITGGMGAIQKSPKGLIILVAAIVFIVISCITGFVLFTGKDLPPPEIEPPAGSTSINLPVDRETIISLA